jgi:hypothetical protein
MLPVLHVDFCFRQPHHLPRLSAAAIPADIYPSDKRRNARLRPLKCSAFYANVSTARVRSCILRPYSGSACGGRALLQQTCQAFYPSSVRATKCIGLNDRVLMCVSTGLPRALMGSVPLFGAMSFNLCRCRIEHLFQTK